MQPSCPSHFDRLTSVRRPRLLQAVLDTLPPKLLLVLGRKSRLNVPLPLCLQKRQGVQKLQVLLPPLALWVQLWPAFPRTRDFLPRLIFCARRWGLSALRTPLPLLILGARLQPVGLDARLPPLALRLQLWKRGLQVVEALLPPPTPGVRLWDERPR